MDDEIDGIRDRLAAALAEVDGFSVVDSAQVADTFRRYKVTVDEEKTGLVPGIFTGGSVPRVAQMLGCDYIAAATVVDMKNSTRLFAADFGALQRGAFCAIAAVTSIAQVSNSI